MEDFNNKTWCLHTRRGGDRKTETLLAPPSKTFYENPYALLINESAKYKSYVSLM